MPLSDLDNTSRPFFHIDLDIPPLTTEVSAMLSYTRPSSISTKISDPAAVDLAQNNALDTLSFAASQAASSTSEVLRAHNADHEFGSSQLHLTTTKKLVEIRPRLKKPPRSAFTLDTKPARKPKRQCPVCNGYFGNLATHKSVHISKETKPHGCFVCGRTFARSTDLSRHEQSHQQAVFKCPLFTDRQLKLSDPNGWDLNPGCHQSGCFSRADTYKNHMKTMHFEYPPGTKKQDRRSSHGKCKGCGQAFENTQVWITDHIESGLCGGVKSVASIPRA